MTQRATHSRTLHISRLDRFSATASFSRSPSALSSPGGVGDGKAYVVWMHESAGECRNADEGVMERQEG